MRAKPVLDLLAPGRLGIDQPGERQAGDEDLGLPHLAMVDDDNGVAGVVDLQRVAGAVLLAHGDAAPLAAAPAAEQLTELAKAVAARVDLQVFAPDQLQRQMLVTTQLALDLGITRTAPAVDPMRLDRLTVILTGPLS